MATGSAVPTNRMALVAQVTTGVTVGNAFATLGALTAALAPAVMASADTRALVDDGTGQGRSVEVIQLRGSISSYWNVEPRFAFSAPLTFAAVVLLFDGVISTFSAKAESHGERYQNIPLGLLLLGLTWFNKHDHPVLHDVAAYGFFLLFGAVMLYGAVLGITGRPSVGREEAHNREAVRTVAMVSLTFALLLVFALLLFWPFGLIEFLHFQMFALVSFAFHYVLHSFHPFPSKHYEFRSKKVNRVLQGARRMNPRTAMELKHQETPVVAGRGK